MRIKAENAKLVHEFGSGWILSFSVSGDDLQRLQKGFEELTEAEVAVSIEKWKEQRSLTANAYFHKLVNLIAEKINRGEDEVKRDLIVNYGAQAYQNGEPIFINLPSGIDPAAHGIKYSKWFAESSLNGKKVDCFLVYRGSHTYNTKEMSRLITGAEQEARSVGITDLMRRQDWERMLNEEANKGLIDHEGSQGKSSGAG